MWYVSKVTNRYGRNNTVVEMQDIGSVEFYNPDTKESKVYVGQEVHSMGTEPFGYTSNFMFETSNFGMSLYNTLEPIGVLSKDVCCNEYNVSVPFSARNNIFFTSSPYVYFNGLLSSHGAVLDKAYSRLEDIIIRGDGVNPIVTDNKLFIYSRTQYSMYAFDIIDKEKFDILYTKVLTLKRGK